jgi:hypothetical protein
VSDYYNLIGCGPCARENMKGAAGGSLLIMEDQIKNDPHRTASYAHMDLDLEVNKSLM